MSDLTDKEAHILRHTLGLNQSAESYRNHFVASEGHDDMPTLLALEERGLMARRPVPTFINQDSIVFYVTEHGQALARETA